MKSIRKYLITNCKFWKLKSSTPYKDELTVFIKVKIEILKAFSKEIPKNVRNEERKNNDMIKIRTDKKYLLIIKVSKLIFENSCLFEEIFLGLACEIKLFNENLNKTYIFKNLSPELVEKKEPPIITKSKNIKDKFLGLLPKEKPTFEILLTKLKNNKLKSYVKFKKEKKIITNDNK